MACNNNCGSFPYAHFNYTPSTCSSNAACTCDASTINYSGPALTCLDVESNVTLESLIQSIDAKLCEVSGIDWTAFDYHCLTDTYTITTASEFVSAISEVVCQLSDAEDETLDGLQEQIDDLEILINDINAPGPMDGCGEFLLVEGDTINTAFVKVGQELCNINGLIVNGINLPDWDACFVAATPTTLQGAFSILISQICSIQSDLTSVSGITLPTFNNVGSCLASPGATDSLNDTIVKIRTKLCTLPTFDIDALAWGSCVGNPSPGGGANLTAAFDRIIDRTNTAYSLRAVSWSSDFDVTLTSPGDPCSGYNIALNPGAGSTDELVGLSVGDTPGYLLDKLTAGTGITFDTVTTPGTLIIESSSTDTLVKADSGDAAAGYLIDKIEGAIDVTNSIVLTETYDATLDKVIITPNIDWGNLWTGLITEAVTNSTIMAEICSSIVCACDCDTTTTSTTTAAPDDFIVFRIINNSDVDRTFAFNSDETGPVTFLSTSAMTVLQGATFTSGAYFTTTGQPITGSITYVNNTIETMDYDVNVVDSLSTPVPGSSTFSGTLTSGATAALTPFVYGSVIGKYVEFVIS